MVLGREATKLDHNFRGISTLTKNPDLIIVVDPRHDHIAVTEANQMKIPVVGIMSSDCNASLVTYPVFVNDALKESVATTLGELVQALQTGQAAFIPKPATPRTAEHRPRTRTTA